ncbi:MAG TPA: glycosyltransferase family 39 protein [Deltaproteobacteria bacterium]|nr:glycosyltransferase family 39 protein [Deltaproteobacteria bacterium]
MRDERNGAGQVGRFFPEILIAVLLVISIVSVYYRVGSFDFIYYDDPTYVKYNPMVNQGITAEGILWAFSSVGYASNWHPITWLSHMLDVRLFGMDPGMHHLVNVLFHAANTVLLFFILLRMTGERWKCAAVAFLFALHPLHVESVAWIAERKDVLSTLFFMLTLWAYSRYVEDRGLGGYFLVLAAYALGLLAKPMLVTVPFVLLLLDFWPLKRKEWEAMKWGGVLSLVVEKVPLFALAAASSVVTFVAQARGGAMSGLELTPMGSRLANAVTAYAAYIGKMLWPMDLAVFYPYPASIDPLAVLGSLALLVLEDRERVD